jgi:hypothetical protein
VGGGRATTRRRSAAGAVVALVLTLAACTTRTNGAAVPAARPSTGSSATGVPSACDPTRLPSCLMPAPPGSTQWGKPYAPNGAVTLDQFLDRVYYGQNPSQRQEVIAQLNAQGLRDIAHASWHASNSDDADLVLLGFTAPTGATSRTVQMVHAYASDADYQQVSLPSSAKFGISVFAYRQLDSQGEVPAIGFAAFGPVAMEFFFWSLAGVDQTTLTSWLTTEATLLAGAR